ncbi:Peptidyl-prolyl isomerase cwc27 [Borealophlyctis nickersoniae]|nr:Peptidyl-prolyl isomerase cwc27 [Borealophlyctis nickersoniae]
MANTGPDTNQSQFFFTLDRTDELNRKNTIFGKIVGDTIFNLLKISEMEVDEDERPLYPTKIQKVVIMSNPFEDIEPRTTPEERAARAALEKARAEQEQQAKKPKGRKNLSLLSFGEDAEDGETAAPVVRTTIKSSHDVLDDPRLSKSVAVELPQHLPRKSAPTHTEKTRASSPPKKRPAKDSESEDDESDDSDQDYDRKMREKVKKKLKTRGDDEAERPRKGESAVGKTASVQDEIRKLQKEIRGKGSTNEGGNETSQKLKGKSDKLLERIRSEYLTSGKVVTKRRKGKGGDEDLLSRLNSFRTMLKTADRVDAGKGAGTAEKLPTEDEDWECDLHFVKGCKSCRDTFGQEEEGDDVGWMAAKLVFAKDVGANVYEPKVEDYTVIDPREGAKTGDITGKTAAAVHKERNLWKDKPLQSHSGPRRDDRSRSSYDSRGGSGGGRGGGREDKTWGGKPGDGRRAGDRR